MTAAKTKAPKKARAFVDGASRGNPGPASVGVVIDDGAGKVLLSLSEPIGVATNNVAEYMALVFALQQAVILGIRELDVYTDSELMARQFSGQYKVKDASLKLFSLLIAHLRKGFTRLTVTHVPREQNRLADAEANKALDRSPFLL